MAADAFDILGLPPKFALTRAEIERAYLRRASPAHPDHEDAEASGLSAATLNEARTTLLDAERRAAALLARLGGPSKESDRSLPAGFLEAMMEAREAMETELAEGGARASAKWKAWAEERRRECEARVGSLFESRPVALGEVRRELNAWRYIERLAEQIDPG